VTGAARGLGACIAARFYDRGYCVALTDLDEEAATKAAAELDPDRAGTPSGSRSTSATRTRSRGSWTNSSNAGAWCTSW
jgi:NAD(P)-dependent dehydrogenase (short-subunit alcohol dehydrogenase family)